MKTEARVFELASQTSVRILRFSGALDNIL